MAIARDWRFWVSIAAAHILLFTAFSDRDIFWYIYTAANLFLISISIISEPIDDQQNTNQFLVWGVLSGVVLYGFFAAGYALLQVLPLTAHLSAGAIYNTFSPQFFWHYIVLVLIFIPGEELFWRGFVQKRLSRYMNEWIAAGIASLLYMSIFIYSGQWLWITAALVAGFFWGALYIWRKSIPLLIVSHVIFDLLLIVFLPLR